MQHKRVKHERNYSEECRAHVVSLFGCLKQAKREEKLIGTCDQYQNDLWDCLDSVKQREKSMSAAKFRLNKFMKGRDKIGILL